MSEGFRALKLLAFDNEDLKIISALLQDSIISKLNISYNKSRKEFIFFAKRYIWEFEKKNVFYRVDCVIKFNNILSVKSKNFNKSLNDILLEFLAFETMKNHDNNDLVILRFSGNVLIKLVSDCIDCELRDVSKPFKVFVRPEHRFD